MKADLKGSLSAFFVFAHTLHTPPPACRYVTAVAVSPHQDMIATGSMDRSVNVWRIGGELGQTGKYTQKTFQNMHRL